MLKLIITFRDLWVSRFIHFFAPVNAWLLRSKPPIVQLNDLLQMASGTLGKETALILKEQNYDFIKHYESHDIKHVLLDYPMNALGEVRMQFFALGNGNYYPPTWGVCALGLFLFPLNLNLFYKDYMRGKKSISLTHINIKDWVHLPINLAKENL